MYSFGYTPFQVKTLRYGTDLRTKRILGEISQKKLIHCSSSGMRQVIEAVYENAALKQEMFDKLDRIVQPKAVLCTNTSRISIDKVGADIASFKISD